MVGEPKEKNRADSQGRTEHLSPFLGAARSFASLTTGAATHSPLHPYFGPLHDWHRPGSFLRWEQGESPEAYEQYLADYHNPKLPERYRLDGDWGYEINSLGYRGEEYCPDAEKHIFACGCSYTYGMGIRWHQTFPYVFKEKYAEIHRLKLEEVNLLNFSQQGASNDYIARTAMTQCAALKPDLLLVLFTSKDRLEYATKKSVSMIGSWIQNEESQNYYCFYTEELGLINLLKNILLVQNFCKLRQINYFFSLFYYAELANPDFCEHPAIKPLLDQIDRRFLCPFSLIDFRCDVGRQCHHPGPLSNLRFGRKLSVHYERLRQQKMID